MYKKKNRPKQQSLRKQSKKRSYLKSPFRNELSQQQSKNIDIIALLTLTFYRFVGQKATFRIAPFQNYLLCIINLLYPFSCNQ